MNCDLYSVLEWKSPKDKKSDTFSGHICCHFPIPSPGPPLQPLAFLLPIFIPLAFPRVRTPAASALLSQVGKEGRLWAMWHSEESPGTTAVRLWTMQLQICPQLLSAYYRPEDLLIQNCVCFWEIHSSLRTLPCSHNPNCRQWKPLHEGGDVSLKSTGRWLWRHPLPSKSQFPNLSKMRAGLEDASKDPPNTILYLSFPWSFQIHQDSLLHHWDWNMWQCWLGLLRMHWKLGPGTSCIPIHKSNLTPCQWILQTLVALGEWEKEVT